MAASPRVSIILIFFNGERFIGDALESVCTQTFSDWELIAVDDGSTDGSRAVADEFARRDPIRICCVEHPGFANRGMSASRNLGIRASRGDYVTFLDADDVFMPDKLEQQVALLDAHPRAAVVVGPNLRWYDWGQEDRDRQRDVVQDLRVPMEQIVEPPDILAAYLREPKAVPLSLMIRRPALEQVGGYVDAFRGAFEDQAAMARIFLAHPAYVSSRIHCKYRQHPDSCVARATRHDQGWQPRLRFLHWLNTHLRQSGNDQPLIRAIVRSELRKTARAQWRWRVRRSLAGLKRMLGVLRRRPGKV